MTTNNQKLDARAFAVTEIARLVAQYHVTRDDLDRIFQTEKTQKSSLLPRVLSYVGGVLVLSGLVFFLGKVWDDLDSLLRVALTFGPGLIALVMAIIVARQTTPQSLPISTPLFALAALFETCGLFVFLDEYGSGHDGVLATLFISSILSVQFFLVFAAVRRPVTLLLGLGFAHIAFAALFEHMGIMGRHYTTVLGASGLLIAAYLSKSRSQSITPLGFFISGFSLTTGLGVTLHETPFDILLIGAGGFLVYVSVVLQSRTLLFVSIVSLLGYLGYYTEEYFADAIGWPLALIFFGLTMIISANYAYKLGRQFQPRSA